jgi:hypothetical protein
MKPHELQRKIHQLCTVIYAVVFVIISLIAVHYNLTTGNVILDVAFIGLAAGLVSYEVAYYHGNSTHTRKKK